MAILHKADTETPTTMNGSSTTAPFVGKITSRGYDEHAQAPAVRERIARARQSWQRAYGYDPAAARVKAQSQS